MKLLKILLSNYRIMENKDYVDLEGSFNVCIYSKARGHSVN